MFSRYGSTPGGNSVRYWGTAGYMAPEIKFVNDGLWPSYSWKVDMFAWGAVWWWMVTMTLPPEDEVWVPRLVWWVHLVRGWERIAVSTRISSCEQM